MEQAAGLMAELALVENMERQDLNVVEMAYAYKNMMAFYGHNQSSLARALGINRHDVVRHIKVLDLSAPLLEQVATAGISKTAAYLLAEFSHEQDAKQAFEQIVAGNLSTGQLRKQVQQANALRSATTDRDALKRPESTFNFQRTFQTIERSVSSMLDARSQLSHGQISQLKVLRDQLDQMLEEAMSVSDRA
jgi:ParB family chromosome partitioning protein